LILGLVCQSAVPVFRGLLLMLMEQDNAGKTTLLYRLKVCHLSPNTTRGEMLTADDRLEKWSRQYPQ
jgi:hypothetical protein